MARLSLTRRTDVSRLQVRISDHEHVLTEGSAAQAGDGPVRAMGKNPLGPSATQVTEANAFKSAADRRRAKSATLNDTHSQRTKLTQTQTPSATSMQTPLLNHSSWSIAAQFSRAGAADARNSFFEPCSGSKHDHHNTTNMTDWEGARKRHATQEHHERSRLLPKSKHCLRLRAL